MDAGQRQRAAGWESRGAQRGVGAMGLQEGFYIKERSHIKAVPSGSQERYRLPKALGALTYFVMRPLSL